MSKQLGSVHVSLRLQKQRTTQDLGPLKGAMSAQKVLQGSETETRELLGGMKEYCVLPDEGSLICPPGKSTIFITNYTQNNCIFSGQT